MRAHGLVAALICTAIFLLGRYAALKAPSYHDSPASAKPVAIRPAEAAVVLSSEQLQALYVEAVGSRRFPLQFDAVGSVSFEEDPAVIQAESTLLTAQATFDAAHRELTRLQDLGESNGIAAKELEGARAVDLSAAAAVKAAREALRASGVSDREVEGLVRSGVFALPARAGKHAWILVNVTESDTPKIRIGERVRVSVPAYPDETFEGRVARVYATLDPNSHRLALRAQVIDPNRRLRPGMLADVAIKYGTAVEAVAIPTTAAVREPDGRMVAWTTTDRSHFFPRQLTLGRQYDGRYQVLSGLKSGDLVVTEGGVFLSNLLTGPPSD